MPSAMTFDTLLSTLQAYLERGGSLDTTVNVNLPGLINTAERALARRFKVQGQLTPQVSEFQVGLPVYAKPDRWRLTASMSYGGQSGSSSSPLTADSTVTADSAITADGSALSYNFRKFLFARSLEYCQTYWPDQTLTGPPQFYADYDYYHWLIVPTPDQAYPWAINSYLIPPLLDSSNQTNWLTEFCPNLLLYRALLESTPFLKNDERIGVWQGFYKEELDAVSTEDLQKAADRTFKRNQS